MQCRRRENFGTTTLPSSGDDHVDLISGGLLTAQNKNNWDVNVQADVSSTENVDITSGGVITISATKIEDGMDATCCANIGCANTGEAVDDYTTYTTGDYKGCCEDSLVPSTGDLACKGTNGIENGVCGIIDTWNDPPSSGEPSYCDPCGSYAYMHSLGMSGVYPTKNNTGYLAYCEPSASQAPSAAAATDSRGFCDMTNAGWSTSCYESGEACQCCEGTTMQQGNFEYDDDGNVVDYDWICKEPFGDFTYPATNLYLEDKYNPCKWTSAPSGWVGTCTDGTATITSPPVVCGAQRYCSGQVETSSGEFGAGNFLLVQASIPRGPALWSAIWLKGVCPDGDDCWPEAGELDLMEHGGMLDTGDTAGYQYEENAFFSTIHCNHKIAPFGPADCADGTQTTGYYYDENFGSKCTTAGCLIAPKGFTMSNIEDDNWYGLYWSSDGNTVSIYTADSSATRSQIEASPETYLTLRGSRSIGDDSTYNCSFGIDQKFNVIINLAIGGNIGGGDEGVDELDDKVAADENYLAGKTLKISAAIIYKGEDTKSIFEGGGTNLYPNINNSITSPITATPQNGDPFGQTFGTVNYSGFCLECASGYSPCCTGDCDSTAAGNWTCTDDCSTEGGSYCNQCQTSGFAVKL